MKCLLGAGATQRTGVQPDETQEEPGLESPHSASMCCRLNPEHQVRPEAMAKGEADQKLQAMTTNIVSTAAERFRKEEKKISRTSYSKNQRAVKIHNIRKEMKSLKSQHKGAGEEECIGLAQLMCILRKNIRVLRQAE
ncbi:hypothetical protein AOLI_G00007770 [Acnodon oligacanthus]